MFKSHSIFKILLFPLIIFILSGCSKQVSETFGKQAPDEFVVLKKAPLIIPPDYDLRPPGSKSTGNTIDGQTASETGLEQDGVSEDDLFADDDGNNSSENELESILFE